MSNRPAPVRQNDATRIFKAANAAGYSRIRLVVHPDGRTEWIAERTAKSDQQPEAIGNEWDEVLK